MGTIRIRPSKEKKADGSLILRYSALVRLKGTTRVRTFKTQTQAKDWIEKEEARIKREANEGTLITGHHTVNDAIQLYREHELEHVASETWGFTLDRLASYLGDIKLTDLKQADILNARNKYRKSRTPFLSNSTCNKFTTCLRNVLRLARKFEMMVHEPFRGFERLGEEGSKRTRYLSDDERVRLLAEAKRSRNPHLYAIISVAIMTGFRRGTIRYLRWSNVDLETNMIRLSNARVNEQGKRGKPRCPNVPIVPPLRAILKEHQAKYKEQNEFVFPSPDDPSQPVDFQTAWKVARKNAKLTNFRFHDLRHTTGTYLGRMGVPLHIIQQILGHSDPKMTMRYVQTVDETVKLEMARTFSDLAPEVSDGTKG